MYTYTDADGDLEGTSTFRWLRDDVAIDGATSKIYTTTTYDIGHILKFEVTPVAQTGELTGIPVSITYTGEIVKRPTTGSTIKIQQPRPVYTPPTITPTKTPTPPNTNPVPKPTLNTTIKILKLNSRNNEVKNLQIYLNSKGYTISNTGPGSKGNETNFFGPKTKQALIKFQLANGLKGDGVLGPLTLLKMK